MVDMFQVSRDEMGTLDGLLINLLCGFVLD